MAADYRARVEFAMPKRTSPKPQHREASHKDDEKQKKPEQKPRQKKDKALPAILFDLDGTLLDSTYQHMIAWHDTLDEDGITIPNARIHRLIGMSGKLLVHALLTELGQKASEKRIERWEKIHKRKFARMLPSVRLLPGARELLSHLSRAKVRWAIGTSGDRKTIEKMIKPLHVPAGVPVVCGDDVARAKPDPDVFLEAANQLGVALSDCIVIGDSVWDLLSARRAKALGVGLLSGGYGHAELEQAGAYRVYKDPEELLQHISEIGIPPAK
jgi:HAD superfamily hydrolase (TIGR01509 family)